MLRPHFSDIVIHDLPGIIEVQDPEPVLNHLKSYESFAQKTGVPFVAIIDRAQRLLTEHLEQHESFTIRCAGGILTGIPRSAFDQHD